MGLRARSTGAPEVEISEQELLTWLSQQCLARGVTSDAQWNAVLTNAANLSDAQLLTLMRQFLARFIRITA